MKKLFLFLLWLYVVDGHAQAIPVTGDGYHLYGPNSTWGEYLQVGGNGNVTGYAFVAATNGNLHLDSKPGFDTFINYYNHGNTFISPQGGKVGVGTTTPVELLEVNGNILTARIRTGNAFFSNNSRSSFNSFNNGSFPSLSPGWIAADFGGSDNASDRLVVGTGFAGKVVIGTHNYDLTSWGGDLIISPLGGNVGIGTTNPRERLSVNGKIRAHEIKVEVTGWPDYVFKEGYKVERLEELERYIKSNKHLPEMPSAKEAEANGIALGEMNKVLLKKIEELTLHLIEKDKELRKEKAKNAVQDKRLAKLEKLVGNK